MEIPDDQFLSLWQEISEALVRIAARISREKKTAWQEAIDDYRKDPLTADDERNVKELERWYKNDMDVKKTVEELKTTTQEGMDHLKSLKTSLKDFQVEFEETSRMMERGAQCLETAVREEAQDIKDKLEEIHHELMDISIASVARSRSTGVVQLQNDYKDTEGPGTQGRASGTSIIHQEPQAVVQGATVALISLNQPQVLITRGIGGENVGNRSIPSAQDVLSATAFKYAQSVNLLKQEDFIECFEHMEKMRKVQYNHDESRVAKKILKKLWKNYRTGQVNKMAQTFLLAEKFLKEHGLIEEYTACRQGALKPPAVELQNDYEDTEGPALQTIASGTSIIPQESQAVVQGVTVTSTFLVAENFPREDGLIEDYSACRQGALKPPATDSSALAEKVSEQIEQLSRRRTKLHDAVLRWKSIRACTMKQLEKPATILHEHHRNATKATITGASMGTVGGILALAGLITAPFTFGAGLIVSLVGAGIGGGGGLVMTGSKAVEKILEKSGLKEVQAAIEEDRKACIKLQEQLDSLESYISSLTEFLKPLRDDVVLLRELEGSGFEFLRALLFFEDIGSSNEGRVEFGARFFRAATSAATISSSAVATAGAVARSAALAGTRAAHFAGSAIGVALLPIDIAFLVKSSLDLHRGSTSAAVEDIRRILNELECPDEEEIQGFVESFIAEKFTEAYKQGQIKKDHQ